jgi:ATP-dependent RNA helicase RhlB
VKFEELKIHKKILEGIKAAGFTECTPVQEQTLPLALRGKDIAAQAQTGTGKTANFLISLFSRMLDKPPLRPGPSPRVLIIAPTRELVIQIEAEAKLLGKFADFKIVSVYGGIDYQKQRDEVSKKGIDMLVGTPGRLIDYLKQKVYSLNKTQFLVIDEADRMFDMGFISDLRFLLRRMSPYNKRQSMLFSATLSNRVLELCYEHMNLPEQFSLTPEKVTVEVVEQELYHVGKSEKFGMLLGILKREPDGHYLIFCNTRVVTERVEALLNANGYESAAITGGLPQAKRMRVLSKFKEGKMPTLVATDVASRGIHIDGVTHVINYDLPQDPEDYVHRIGRTARAGAHGRAITLACEEYVHSLPDIEDYIKQKIPVMPITDEMIVTEYRRRVRSAAKKGPAPTKSPSGKKSASGKKGAGPKKRGRTADPSKSSKGKRTKRGPKPRGHKGQGHRGPRTKAPKTGSNT